MSQVSVMEEDTNWKPVAIKSEIQLDETEDDENFTAGYYQEDGCEVPSTEVPEVYIHLTSGANTNSDVPNLVQRIKVEYIEDEDSSTDQCVSWHTPTTEAAVSFQRGASIKSEHEPIEDTRHHGRWHTPVAEDPSVAIETNLARDDDRANIRLKDYSILDARGVEWHVPAVKVLAPTPKKNTSSSATEIKIESEDVANQGPLNDREQSVPLLSAAFPTVKIATVRRGDGKVKGDLILCPRQSTSEDVAQKDLKEKSISPSEKPSDSISDDAQFEFIDCGATIKQEVIDTGPNRDNSSDYQTATINQEMLDMSSNRDDPSDRQTATINPEMLDTGFNMDDPSDHQTATISQEMLDMGSNRDGSSDHQTATINQEMLDTGFNMDDSSNHQTATINQEMLDMSSNRDDPSDHQTATINQEMLDTSFNMDDSSDHKTATINQEMLDRGRNKTDPNDKRSLRSRRFKPTTSERCYSSEKEEFSIYQRPPAVEQNRVVQRKISQPTENRHRCPLCPKSFLQIRNLHKHVLIHAKMYKEYSCSISKSTPRLTRWYSCTNCEKRFRYKREYVCHALLPCKGEISSCELCPAKFRDPEDLSKHLVAHFREKSTFCMTCSTLLKGVTCKACATQYRWQATLKPFTCKQCDNKIRVQLQVRNHLLTKFEDIKFTCGRCFTKYKWPVLAKEPCEDTS